MQQNSFSRNLNFHFSIYTFFRQSALPPLVGMTACRFHLLALSAPSTPHTHMQPQSHRSPWALPLQASGPHLGLLVRHAEPVLSRPSLGCARWQCSRGIHGAGSRMDRTRLMPCVLAYFHACFHTVHCRLSRVQMLGHRQLAGKPGADYRLLPDSKERRSRSLAKILDLYWGMGKVGRHLIY